MKKFILSITLVLLLGNAFSQAPQSFKYQAVVRDAAGMILENQPVGMQISIRVGDPVDTIAYQETFATTTNAFGLVNLEIGAGAVVQGDFSVINWGADSYLVEVAVDATGGTNYTLMGTSQLLSVPYALHAESAATADYNSLSNTPVNLSDFNNDTGFITNPDDADADPANELQTIARDGLTVTLSDGGGLFTDSVNVYLAGDGIEVISNVISESKYAIGDTLNGGIVFWLDESGEHGLVAALNDQNSGLGASWYNGTTVATAASGDGLGAGEMNSLLIVAEQKYGAYAAKLCTDLVVAYNGVEYGHWYLPSKYELNLLYEQKNVIGGFASAFYWSSSEVDNANAWFQSFSAGFQNTGSKVSNFRVRAISSF